MGVHNFQESATPPQHSVLSRAIAHKPVAKSGHLSNLHPGHHLSTYQLWCVLLLPTLLHTDPLWVRSNWCLGMDRCVNVLRSLPSVQALTSWKLGVSYPFPCTLLSYLSPVKEKSQEKQSHLSPTHALPLNVLLHLHPPQLTLQPEGRWMRDLNQILSRIISHTQLSWQLEGMESGSL